MKTSKNLFDGIVSFENVLSAAQKAAKGKRENQSVLLFFNYLEENLWELISALQNKTYQPGSYKTFSIYKPKPRLISAAPFRDRVVHHALISVVGPILERSFIFDTYANRADKGTHKAIERYQHYLKKYDYVLKCDIRKYFPSIDHEILKSKLRNKISCSDTLWLIDTIIDNSNLQAEHVHYFPGDGLFTPYERRRGLPIGNLTSQFFANYYLSFLDHYVKEVLRCKGYVRYVDDCAPRRRTGGRKSSVQPSCKRDEGGPVCPAKAGVFSRKQTCRGKSQKPRNLDSRVAGDQKS